MSTDRNVTVIFSGSGMNPMATSTGIERYNIKDMKIGDRIKAYCVPVGEGDNKADPYITLDINDALDHIEKYHGKKFGNTVTVTCMHIKKHNSDKDIDAADQIYDEGATTYQAAMGFYAYKVDKGLLMANVIYRNTTLRILNRQNLYSGDGWRLLGLRELSKYIFSDLNGTINPNVNPWNLPNNGYGWNTYEYYTFYQEPHNSLAVITLQSGIKFITDGRLALGWPMIDRTNIMSDTGAGDRNYVSLFLYQYVESENATNIYY